MGERVGERAAERIGEKIGERAAERLGERIGERAAERIGERVGERAAERMGERIGERAIERVGSTAAERLGQKTIGGMGERVVEQAGRSTAAKLASRSTMASHAVTSSASHMVGGITARAVERVTRGVLIALPALGGAFAMYMCFTDYKRALREASDGSLTASKLFLTASGCDAVDAVAHIVIVYGMLEGWGHHALLNVETISIASAVVSTVGALAGEVVSMKHMKQKAKALGAEGDANIPRPPRH